MVTDHGAVQKSVIELAGKLHLTPVENDTSNSLKAKSVEVTAKLKSLRGKAFDKFYIDNEVAYHKQVTDAIDRKSTRLNSSHGYISYAVFCLKKKKNYISPHDAI